MSPRDLIELGLLQVEHTQEEDPEMVSALAMDFIPGWIDWDCEAV